MELTSLNTLKTPSTAKVFFSLNAHAQLPELLALIQQTDLPVFVLGGGSNVVLSHELNALTVHVQLKGYEIISEIKDTVIVEAAAGEHWHAFVQKTIEDGLNGLENLSLIPGTVGAAPVQNIGAYGVELCEVFESLEAIHLSTGERRVFDKSACQFAYRESFFKTEAGKDWLILSVRFRLSNTPSFKLDYTGLESLKTQKSVTAKQVSDRIIALRQSKLPDPEITPNAGSFFKNPVVDAATITRLLKDHKNLPHWQQKTGGYKLSAAWLIEQSGFKGVLKDGLGMSEKHALVLVNTQAAEGEAIYAFAQTVIKTVRQKFSITITPEPRFIGL